jgi:hypothetical protein
MDDENSENRSGASFERHIQTILISIVTGGLIFAITYFYNDNKDKAVSKSQLEVLTVQVFEMRADVKSLQLNVVRPDEVRDLQRRMLDLERSVKAK